MDYGRRLRNRIPSVRTVRRLGIGSKEGSESTILVIGALELLELLREMDA